MVRKSKIAFIHPDLGIGGAERLILDAACALNAQKHEVLFITNHFDSNHCFEELKGDTFKVQVVGDWLPRDLYGRFHAICAYIRMIYLTLIYLLFLQKEDEADIYFVDLIPISIPFLKLARQKVVYYCHHPDLLASPPGGFWKKMYRLPIDWLEYKSTDKADIILVNSEYTASVFKSTFPKISKPIQVLYPTIASSYQKTISKLTTNGKMHIHHLIEGIPLLARTVFLSINRFHPAKGLELAIHAMEELRDKASVDDWDATFLLLVGGFDPSSVMNASYFDYLMDLIDEKQLQEKVLLLKSPSDGFKAELLLASTCLIYTPVKEHFGIVPLEAMVAEKPVIACNSGGPRETVEHGITGYLCEPDPGSMADFMHKIVKSKNLKEMGSRGKQRLDNEFSYENFSKSLRKVVIAIDKKKSD